MKYSERPDHHHNGEDFEKLNTVLMDEQNLSEYAKTCGEPAISWLPGVLGNFLVWAGNVVYGEKPSYLKFRAVEVIARVPYHSWASAAFTLMMMFYTDAAKAIELSETSDFATLAAENETMHVVVITELTQKHGEKAGVIRFTIIPMLFAFFYFWMSYFLYLTKPAWSLQLNYLFENHAFSQYDRFLKENEEEFKRLPMDSAYLRHYGRNPVSEWDFFCSVRADEVVHRNTSFHELLHLC